MCTAQTPTGQTTNTLTPAVAQASTPSSTTMNTPTPPAPVPTLTPSTTTMSPPSRQRVKQRTRQYQPWRPCSLQQQFIGITEKKAIKRYQVVNEVCYEVLDQAGTCQTLV